MRGTLWLVLWLLCTPVWALTVNVGDDTEVEVTVLAAEQPAVRVVWLPSEHGLPEGVRQVAQALSRRGVEVWLPDLFAAWFLSPSPSAVSEIPASALGRLVAAARRDGLPLFVVAEDRGALLAVRAWQAAQQGGPLRYAGLILINPNLYVATPVPGQTARYWPEVEQLNAPVWVMQSELSPWRWRLSELIARLERGGSDVFVQLWPGVRDRFYFRPDAFEREKQAARRLPDALIRAMALMAPWLEAPRARPRAASESAEEAAAPAEPARDARATLPPYEGPQFPPLTLQTLDGRTLDMRDLRGKVVLVNFWASWCPPCVHEIPSMVALKQALADQPFEILAVNLAEEKPAVEAFLKAHPVNFPVLLDPSGTAVKSWRVFAYPSSYVLDRQGRIRYAAFGALDWNSDEVKNKLRGLINR